MIDESGGLPEQDRARLRELAWARCQSLGLAAPRFATATQVVQGLLAVQAQEHAFSRWSLAQRTPSADDAEVRAALDSGAIVRTHALRPTWHYVAGEDLRWLQALTGPLVRRMSAGWYRNHEVDEDLLTSSRERLVLALQGGRAKTRQALREELSAAGLDVSGQRLTAILMDAEVRALICSGPMSGKHHTYALVEERLPPTPALSEDEAIARLVRRYLAGHGPATLKDLRWWSTLTLKSLLAAIENLGDEVSREVVGGVEYLWAADTAPSEPRGASRAASTAQGQFHLLQVFDELFVGYRETRGLVDPDGEYGAVLPIGYSKMMHVVLEGERLVGRWRSDKQGGGQQIKIRPTRPMSADDFAGLRYATTRYGDFVGLETTTELLD